MRIFEIIDQVLEYDPGADISAIEKAYVFAAATHRGKSRQPGEPYLDHPLAVAGTLAGMRLDDRSIIAGLLCDVLGNGGTTPEEIVTNFGEDISRIVEGLDKLRRLDFSGGKERKSEYIRRMILAMSHDIRVVLVKLAERLHTMRHLPVDGGEANRLLARETQDIYAPLAARMGIDWMKQEFEDLSFRQLESQKYEEIIQGLAKSREERHRYIEEVRLILTANLEEYGISGRVSGRSKHLYSIYQKMARQQLDLSRVFDLTAFRIIVSTREECYEALAMVHELWEPVPGRFKDYIVKPKANLYQSLHTTVIGPYSERMEVQIRTEEMNSLANEGIAAHWLYKEWGISAKADLEETQRFSWLRELLRFNSEWRDPQAFLDSFQVDFYPDEVFVFTPQGDVKVLPRGSTPVDFAYEIHTEVGHRCVGGRVNGKLVPLRQELQNGDTISIITATHHKPSKDWLKFVKTSKAQARIKQWVKAEERERLIAEGKEVCEREFRKKNLNFNNYIHSPELLEVSKSFSLRDVNSLLASVGSRKISPVHIIGRLPSLAAPEDSTRPDADYVETKKPRSTEEGVKVLGVDDVMLRMARCCNPVPGEPVTGYITRGRGVTVHRATCRNVPSGGAERTIEVQWDSGEGQFYPVDIRINHSGEKGTIGLLSGVLGHMDANIVDVQVEAPTVCRLRVEVKDTGHLQRVLSALRSERGVLKVQRA